MNETPPILVVGGGPAGSTVATLLAQRGFPVVLFERSKFPRAHIGESLLPATLATLELSGALDAIRRAAFVQKAGATMVWGTKKEPWSWYFRETNSRFPYSYQVDRPEFDHILLQHARKVGVRVYEETRVDEVLFDAERAVGIRIDNESVEASYVIDATGQNCLISSRHQARLWDKNFANLAIYDYYSDARHLEGEDQGNILIESISNGWLWKIPLKNNVSSVGFVADRNWGVQSIRQNGIQSVYSAALKDSTIIGELLSSAQKRNSTPIVTRDWSYQSKKFAGQNWACVGDAACFIDPLFSTGVHLAVSGAFIAAALTDTALNNVALAKEAVDSYDRLYRQQYEHFRELTALFYGGNRTVDSYFWASRSLSNQEKYSPREAFIRSVSGQNAAGYERTVLQRAATPSQFRKLLEQFATDLTERQATLSRTDLMQSTVVVKQGMRVLGQVVLNDATFSRGKIIRGNGRVDLPVSDFVGELVQHCQNPISVASLVERMATDHSKNEVTDSIKSVVNLLVVDGILELTDAALVSE